MFNEIKDLVGQHHKEAGSIDNLSVNWELYCALDREGKLKTYTARNKNNLVGYIIFILNEHIRYQHSMVAENDVIYLTPEYRKGLTGYRFIKYAINNIKILCDIVTLRLKAKDTSIKLAKRLGFKLTDYSFLMEV